MGVSPGALLASRPDLRTGRLFDDFADGRAERVVVLGRIVAEQLGVTRVDNQPAIFIGNRPYTVIGIIDDTERVPELVQSVIMPSATAAADFENENASYTVLIEVAPGAAQLIASQAADALRPQDPDRLDVNAPPDPGELKEDISSDITGLLYGLAGSGAARRDDRHRQHDARRRARTSLRDRRASRPRRAAGGTSPGSSSPSRRRSARSAASSGRASASSSSCSSRRSANGPPRSTRGSRLPAPIIGAVTGLLAGLQPSLRAARIAPAAALRSE